jgi:hypothetical protein
MFVPIPCSNDMRRLTLLISIVIALVAVAIPAMAGTRSHHHKRHHHAKVADRNHNGMSDRWERRHHVHKSTADPDHDGVKNLGEFHNSTNPRDEDSDNDGVEDGDDDSNHDGIDDGDEQSGTILSFDGTTLIVKLVNGDELKGAVNDRTEIECETAAPAATTRHDGGDDESGDDNSGPGSTTSGSGDQGDDHGDDDGEHGDDDQGEHSSCSTAALVPDTIVREAELRLTSTGAIFHEIELGGKAPA